MNHELELKDIQKEWHGSYHSYLIGLIGALILTLISFGLAIIKPLPSLELTLTIMGLAGLQVMIQLVFFLHLGQEPKPKSETLIFCFTVLILMIIVVGSLWIMTDLNNRMMSNMDMSMDMDHAS